MYMYMSMSVCVQKVLEVVICQIWVLGIKVMGPLQQRVCTLKHWALALTYNWIYQSLYYPNLSHIHKESLVKIFHDSLSL